MKATALKAPIWFWIIAGLSLAWNLFGVWDMLNSIYLNETYLAPYEGWLEFVRQMPFWAKLCWFMATTGAAFGSLFLLLREKLAVPAFLIANVSMLLSFGYQYTSPLKPSGPEGADAFTIVIIVVALALLWLAFFAERKGWLS